jgi:hypothetical protein
MTVTIGAAEVPAAVGTGDERKMGDFTPIGGLSETVGVQGWWQQKNGKGRKWLFLACVF